MHKRHHSCGVPWEGAREDGTGMGLNTALERTPSVTDLYCAVLVVNTCLLMSLNGCKEAQADACLSDWPCQGALSCVFSSIGHDITLAGHVVSDVCSQVQHYVQNTLSDAPATSPKKQGGVFSSRSAVR